MRSRLIGLLALLALLLNGCGGQGELHGLVYQQPRQFDFALTDTKGQPFKASDLDGKAALVFFGYTYCPDICPTTMSEFTQIKEALGTQADDARFLMISVDPERDTAERLDKYVASFDPSFIGLHGDQATIDQLTATYGIVATRREEAGTAGGYLIDHTALAFLIDKQGYLRTGYPQGVDPKLVADDMRLVLGERR